MFERFSAFRAVIYPRSFPVDSATGRADEFPIFQNETEINLPSFRGRIAHSVAAQVACDRGAGVQVLLHGETYGNGNDTAADVLAVYRQSGVAKVTQLHGSFVILIADAARDEVLVITDRINSRKVYSAQLGDVFFFTSSTTYLPRERFELDPIGVGWFLTQGTFYNHRTAFQGVRLLERASVHTLAHGKVSTASYWSYSFDAPSRATEAELAEEMLRLLVESVRRRVGRHQTVFVSLSAGYDSSGLLGVLGKCLKVPGVRCFSYAQDTPQPGSDEYVAGQMARLFHYDHEIVKSFDGDVLAMLRHNVDFGECICEEVNAWLTMGERFAAARDPVLIVGDECLGWSDYRLTNEADLLNSVQIDTVASPYIAGKWMVPGVAESVAEGMIEDGKQMLARCPAGSDWHDRKDFLYLDERMPQTILPRRECYAGRFLPVVNPLLDNDLLDFMKTVPTPWRRQKLLYRRMVRREFPEVFGFRRATFATTWTASRRAVSTYRAQLESALRSGPASRLDSLISPDIGWKVLREMPRAEEAERPTLRSRLRPKGTAMLNWLGVKDATRKYFRPTVAAPPVHQVVWRWLVLRAALTPQGLRRF